MKFYFIYGKKFRGVHIHAFAYDLIGGSASHPF
jgi:hypothetical protein